MFALIIMASLLQAPPAGFDTVGQGPNSGIATPTATVIRNATDWARAWEAHAGADPVPAVDFSNDMVAAVFLGTRPTGGYGVEITALRREGNSLVVEYSERRPDPERIVTEALTSPFHIVKFPRLAGPVQFRQVGGPDRGR